MELFNKKRLQSISLGIFLMLGASIAWADTEGEKAALSRLVHELKALESLVNEAEAQADPTARVRFRYDWLRKDMHSMIEGIQNHIDTPRFEPRTFAPLRGDYRQ